MTLSRRVTTASLPFFQRPLHFTTRLASPDGLPSIMLLLTFRQPKLNFGKTPLGEIDAERDEREPLLLGLPE